MTPQVEYWISMGVLLIVMVVGMFWLEWWLSDLAPGRKCRQKVVEILSKEKPSKDINHAIQLIAFTIPAGEYFSENGMKVLLRQLNYDPDKLGGKLVLLHDEGILAEIPIRRNVPNALWYLASSRYYMTSHAREDFKTQKEQQADTPNLSIVQIKAGKPYTAHLEIAAILTPLKGELRICDPYYGKTSLLRLNELKSCNSVKLLTSKASGDPEPVIEAALQSFVKEQPNCEFRKHVGTDLHDRYIVTPDELILLGHGLKDIGGKESFVIRVGREYAGDVIDGLIASFDSRWMAATPLP